MDAIKPLLSALAIGITCYALVPYLWGIIRRRVRPHVFSWVVWGITTLIVFFAQLEDDGGWGAWAIGFSASLTICIAIMAYLSRGDISITGVDWCFFLVALASLPLWYLTADPVWTVIVLTGIDLLAFGPTLGKLYRDPYSESLPFFLLFTCRNLLVVAALENYTLTTVLFPASITVACVLIMGMMWVRRRTFEAGGNEGS